MDYRSDRIYFKTGLGYVSALVFGVLLFIVLLAVQLFAPDDTACYFIGAALLLLSFLINIITGKLGFYIAFILNFVQFMIYTYDYVMLDKQTSPTLLSISFISMIVNITMQFYVMRITNLIHKVNRSQREERGKRINKELQEEMFKRTSLIVSHDKLESTNKSEMSEAIGTSIQTSIDPLTTLPGRDMITDKTADLIAADINAQRSAGSPDSACHPFSVIYLALDDPGVICRRIGHKSMDLFIQSMAHRVREAADPADMVARTVDADFVILERRNLSPEDCDKYAKSIIDSAAKAFAAGKDSMEVSFSYGISKYPEDSRVAGELIAKAEDAMMISAGRESKHSGMKRPEVPGAKEIFANKTREQIAEIFEKAINDGNLYMAYQPCFSRDNVLQGFEAFMRFEFDGVAVPPPIFIAAAENSDYMRRVGTYSLKQSLTTLAKINILNPNLTMDINISANQLREPDFMETFSNAVSASECNIKNIILDLPEESLVNELTDIRSVIENLASMGVRMALDNFGRGYSSFNAIPLLPVAVLKLDGNFTSNLATDSDVRILTASAISLMHDIDIKVTATGVGREDQYNILSEAGCDNFQGQFLGAQMKAEDALKFVVKED